MCYTHPIVQCAKSPPDLHLMCDFTFSSAEHMQGLYQDIRFEAGTLTQTMQQNTDKRHNNNDVIATNRCEMFIMR